MEAHFTTLNLAELERLRALVDRLSPEDYVKEISSGWTVGATLAHLAYWDEFAMLTLAKLQHQGLAPIAKVDVDLINEAALPLFRGLPWDVLKKNVILAAEEADHAAAATSPDLAEQVIAAGRERLLKRHAHRRMHLDDIEQVVAH